MLIDFCLFVMVINILAKENVFCFRILGLMCLFFVLVAFNLKIKSVFLILTGLGLGLGYLVHSYLLTMLG